MLAFLVVPLTAAFVFCRPNVVADSTEQFSLLLSLPLLAGLGVSPVVGPIFFFFVEVLGTARILTKVHPHAVARAKASVDKATRERQSSAVLDETQKRQLLFRYIRATLWSRLSLWSDRSWCNGDYPLRCLAESGTQGKSSSALVPLVNIPSASINVLEKLGVATAFCVIDDELVCEPHAVPQQLLIPSGKGLKLLDLCVALDDDDEESGSESDSHQSASVNRKRGKSFDSDSEESDEESTQGFHLSLRQKILSRRLIRRRRTRGKPESRDGNQDDTVNSTDSSLEVQFEDPSWWQFLPSLKCIGLASLLVDERLEGGTRDEFSISSRDLPLNPKHALAKEVCDERHSEQLQLLAQSIGFSVEPNSNGPRGDISSFRQKLRLHVLSDAMVKERLELDAHERSSEQARWWGLLRPDSTSVIVQDQRTNAYQLLTVGDPHVVTNQCNEAWQGEISTILPLTAIDRRTIMETTNSWKLADLDVAAFSYSPVSSTQEKRLSHESAKRVYLLEQLGAQDANHLAWKDKNASPEWAFVKNQVFLGVLGSLVVPRREIQKVLNVLSDAGVRFVYFSPRNMRRQKELASQMGIGV